MMRSMFSGVSGLRAHQTKMDVIGNNIANVNTVGFKSGRVTFQEVFNQTLRGAGAPDSATGRGGMNPLQVGMGIGVASVDTISTRGSLQRTDNATDMSIEGEGFFIVRGGKYDTFRFTRAGNFDKDKLGNLVAANGMNVYGWQHYTRNAEGGYEFFTDEEIKPINLYADDINGNKLMIPAKATGNVEFSGNLKRALKPVQSIDASGNTVGTPLALSDDKAQINAKIDTIGTDNKTAVPITVYDKLGNSYNLSVSFVKNKVIPDAANPENITTEWFWYIDGATTSGTGAADFAKGVIAFDNEGKIIDNKTVGGTAYTKDATIKLTPSTDMGTDAFDIAIDFGKISQYDADSSVRTSNVDGYSTGTLVTYSIGPDGILTGTYSNGQQQPLAMLALASFENPSGLQKVGDNMFIPTTNSGDFKKGQKPGSEGVGVLNPGTLEMSNVDLSKEFTEMIITQRGFQANSRIITASDEMLQELVNLKR